MKKKLSIFKNKVNLKDEIKELNFIIEAHGKNKRNFVQSQLTSNS